ncbi:MAG: GldG family protein [Treponema sp.]|nr:GldG family protein [Treponema sp.]
MKTSRVYFSHKLKSLLCSKIFWLDLIVFLFGTAFTFFTKTRFFSPAGTSSLTVYFSAVLYVSVIVLPAIFLKHKDRYDDFVPLSAFKKLLLDFSAKILTYVFLLALLLWMPVFVSFYGDVDWGAVFVSLFALMFYGICAGSICLFVSETVEKTLPAFVVSALVLFVLSACHSISLYFDLPTFVSGPLHFVSFVSRFDSASKGILSSADFVFFLVFSAFMVLGTFVFSENKKGKIWQGGMKIRLGLIVLVLAMTLTDSARINFRMDFSKDKLFSVSPYSKKLLSETDRTVEIHFYRSGKLENLYPSIKNVYSFLKDYEKAGKNVVLKVTDCDKSEKARTLLESYGIYAQRIKTENSTSTEYIDVYSTIILECAGNIQIIPFALSPVSLEYQMDLKILNLVFGYEPCVNILSGNGMTLDDELRLLNDWFLNQGINVREVVPETLSEIEGPLFVFGEDYLSYQQVQLIKDYGSEGKGSVLFCVSPYSVRIASDWGVSENLSCEVTEMLDGLGVSFKPSMVMDYSCQRISMMGDDADKEYAEVINYPLWLNVLPQTNTALGFSMFWTSPLELSGKAVPYILSSSHSYEKNLDFNRDDTLIETNPFTVKLENVYTNAVQTSVLGAFIPVECNDNVSTNYGFYVISDQNFASYYTNGFIGGESGDFRNFMFLTGLFWKMNGQGELSALQQRTTSDTSLYKRVMKWSN